MATMTADEILRFLEAHCLAMSRLESFPLGCRYGVEIYDPKQRRRCIITGSTVRAAVERAQEILEVRNDSQKDNETETA